MDKPDLADYVFDLVFLQMADKMQGAALVCALGVFLLKLLHAVFAADIHACRYRLPDTPGVVHLRCRNELYLVGASSAADCRRRYVFLDRRNIFGNAHIFHPISL